MLSENIYNLKIYVVYHIIYSGNLFPSKLNSNIIPSNYIGSSSLSNIESGYMGSVSSKKYKSIWKQELKEHPELFHLEMISFHDTRQDATWKELQIQKIFNVVKNPLFVNMSYAVTNGCHGRDVSGENHPMYGKTGELSPLYNRSRSEDFKTTISYLMKGNTYGIGNKSKTGMKNTDKQKTAVSTKMAKKYLVINKEGVSFEIENMRKFCELNGLCSKAMYNVASNFRGATSHKGWKCEKI